MKHWLDKLKTWLQKNEKKPHFDSKFMNSKGFTGMDTQKELKEFQHKQKPTKPQAADEDLSQVLNDVLQKPGGPDQGLYPGKKK